MTMDRTMKKVKPTDKQKLFVKAKLENPGISNYKAAIKAGYSPNTAKDSGSAILAKSGVQAFIEKLASDDVISKKLNEGLEAYKVDITGDRSPDFRTRLAYIQEMLGVKGYKQTENPQQTNIQFNITRGEKE